MVYLPSWIYVLVQVLEFCLLKCPCRYCSGSLPTDLIFHWVSTSCNTFPLFPHSCALPRLWVILLWFEFWDVISRYILFGIHVVQHLLCTCHLTAGSLTPHLICLLQSPICFLVALLPLRNRCFYCYHDGIIHWTILRDILPINSLL